jgi:hypothetical protein
MLLIPKPGREIPKSVEKRLVNVCQLIVNLLANSSLCIIGWAGMDRAKEAVVRAMSKPVRLLQNRYDRLAAAIFLSTPKDFEVVPQDPSRTGVGSLWYEGGNNHV